MEASDITTVFFAQEEVPWPCFLGLKLLFLAEEFLVWKTSANEAITIENMDFEQMEAAVAYKAASESTYLLGDSQEEFNILRAQYLSAINDAERVGVLQIMKKLLFDAVLQNLASNCLKSFGCYEESSLKLRMCVLDYRKLFTMDKAKIQPIQNKP